MLYVLGFERSCIAVGDVFFVDPNPSPGQDGAEAGVRVELRHLERPELPGSIYSAQPVRIANPILRVDIFESFPDGLGARDRVHYHPRMSNWEPGPRTFDPELSADPIAWLHKRLTDIDTLLGTDEFPDAEPLAAHGSEVVGRVEALWSEVRSGSLNPPKGWTSGSEYRGGWL